MKYTVTDVTTSHVLVKFDSGSMAHVRIQKDWDKARVEEEISKYIPNVNTVEDYSNVSDVPLSVGDSNDIESYSVVQARLAKAAQEEREAYIAKLDADRKELQKNTAQLKKDRLVDYKERRQNEYPSVGDQLDSLYHAGVFPDDMTAQIKAVKDKWPISTPTVKASEVYPELQGDTIKIVIDGVEIEVPASSLE